MNLEKAAEFGPDVTEFPWRLYQLAKEQWFQRKLINGLWLLKPYIGLGKYL